jgi:hypothetical protein
MTWVSYLILLMKTEKKKRQILVKLRKEMTAVSLLNKIIIIMKRLKKANNNKSIKCHLILLPHQYNHQIPLYLICRTKIIKRLKNHLNLRELTPERGVILIIVQIHKWWELTIIIKTKITRFSLICVELTTSICLCLQMVHKWWELGIHHLMMDSQTHHFWELKIEVMLLKVSTLGQVIYSEKIF